MPKRSASSQSKKQAHAKSLPPAPAVVGTPRFWFTASVLAVSILLVYGPALDAPLIFDDSIAIVKNDSIHSLWPLVGTAEHPGPLRPPRENPMSGRPLVNLTLAFNYAIGALNPRGYHAFSIAVHFCNALLLWAIVRRTLRLPYFNGRFEALAGWLALAAALLWALHPLQTEPVIYASQRTELMMAFFYLAAIYCTIRYCSELPLHYREGKGEGSSSAFLYNKRPLWLTLAILSSAAGMASKEVMVSTPLMALLFDRAFISGSLARAIRRSWPLYLGLAATWLVLLLLNINQPRSQSAGFHLGVSPVAYWLTQCKVLLTYLKLTIWPAPLLIHYDLPYLTSAADAWIFLLPVLLLAVAALVLLARNHPVGFLATWIFAILAPTSIVPITTEVAAERRMYLPLAALVVLFVIGVYQFARRLLRPGNERQPAARRRGPLLLTTVIFSFVLALLCGVASAQHLKLFHNPLAVWDHVLRHQPDNFVAREAKAFALQDAGNVAAAIDAYREVVRLSPNDLRARISLSSLLLKVGRSAEALEHLREIVRLDPNDVRMRNNLASALYNCGRYQESADAFQDIIKLDPNNWMLHSNLATALEKLGKDDEAIHAYETALALNPAALTVYSDVAAVYKRRGKPQKATAALQHGLEQARAAGDAAMIKKFESALSTKE